MHVLKILLDLINKTCKIHYQYEHSILQLHRPLTVALVSSDTKVNLEFNMSAIFEQLAGSKQISTWVEPESERVTHAFNKAELPPLTFIISNWAKSGIEDWEWGDLPNLIGGLIVPPQAQLEGSVVTLPTYKAKGVDIVFTHKQDWVRSIPDEFRSRQFGLDSWEAIAVTDTNLGLEVWANERAAVRAKDLGNTAVVVTVSPVSKEIM